jgi:AbrB family looped-hinge helix DNA binding protein
MKATIDKAGRLVIPRQLRDAVGLAPGYRVEVLVDGGGIRVEPLAAEGFVEEDGFLVIPAGGDALDDAAIRELRRADQR